MRERGPSQVQFWLLAVFIGIGAGFAALGFRLGIGALQRLIYGADDLTLATVAERLPWYWVLIVPVIGGLIVGLILDRFTSDGRVRAVADVIEGAALEGGRVETREGLASAAASLITLGTGGSSGREGPVVHLAGVISTTVASRIKASPMTGRDLLGCAVAGAVAASFNAPIAGALFAHEVVLRHFALHAFAPIAISAVVGTVINRLQFGGLTEFELEQEIDLAFYVELPAFMLLGLVSALVAAAMMKAIFRAEKIGDRVMNRIGWPRWSRPAIAGLLLGLIAIPFPHIIGVGYETTAAALAGRIGLTAAIIFAVVKAVAVAITFGGRMGGGGFLARTRHGLADRAGIRDHLDIAAARYLRIGQYLRFRGNGRGRGRGSGRADLDRADRLRDDRGLADRHCRDDSRFAQLGAGVTACPSLVFPDAT